MFWIIAAVLIVIGGWWLTTDGGQQFMRRLGWTLSNNNNRRFLLLLLFILAANITYPFLCSFPIHEDRLYESTRIAQDMYRGKKSAERTSSQPSWVRLCTCSGVGWLAILGWPAVFGYAPIAFNDEWHRALDAVRRRRESADQDLKNLPQIQSQQGQTPQQVGQAAGGLGSTPLTWRSFFVLDVMMEFAESIFHRLSR